MPVATSYFPRPSMLSVRLMLVSLVLRAIFAVLTGRLRLVYSPKTAAPALASQSLRVLQESPSAADRCVREFQPSSEHILSIQDRCFGRGREFHACAFPAQIRGEAAQSLPAQNLPG